ncbi:hypothetical protein ACFDTO_18465 [Microbacteriaceae bacterium 4G12]
MESVRGNETFFFGWKEGLAMCGSGQELFLPQARVKQKEKVSAGHFLST